MLTSKSTNNQRLLSMLEIRFHPALDVKLRLSDKV
jgi:hypothetical protein